VLLAQPMVAAGMPAPQVLILLLFGCLIAEVIKK